MLTYAFNVLNENGYKNISTEKFHNVMDLYAAILIKGVELQLKRGLGKEYITETDTVSVLRGKIDVNESIKKNVLIKNQLVCTYDEFTVNTPMNRIIKSTLNALIKSSISKSQKKEIRKLVIYFDDVDLVDIHSINWSMNYNRNNQTYRMLISICSLVIHNLLLTTSEGVSKHMDFIDEQRMSRLYEKFILEYYRKEFPQIKVNASQIPWVTDDEFTLMLPTMQTDIFLSYEENVLIIDAKYYKNTVQTYYDKQTLHSANLYQIFTYVKNEAIVKEAKRTVSGMLLYAKVDEDLALDSVYQMSGNKISVKTLDLNCEFNQIAEQLNSIVFEHFGIVSE